MFDDRYLGRYLFFSILITVVVAESLILLYTRLETPTTPPAQKKRAISVHITAMPPAPKVQKEPIKKPEKRVVKQVESKKIPAVKPKPKPKPKVQPRPRPKPKVKPKPKPVEMPKPEPCRCAMPKPPAAAPPVASKIRPTSSVTSQQRETIEREKAAYLRKVRETIERHKYYPRIAKRLRMTGVVEVQLTILKNGSIKAVSVVKPSRHSRLNRAAMKTIEKIGRFAPLPEVFDTETLTLRVPIRYTLKRR